MDATKAIMVFAVIMELRDPDGIENQFVEVFSSFPTADRLVEVMERWMEEALSDGDSDVYLSRARTIFTIRNAGMPSEDNIGDNGWAVLQDSDDIGSVNISICKTELI